MAATLARIDAAQLCKGDSGGPLLGVIDGEQAIFGVLSSGFQAHKPCQFGSVHATFGPRTRELVEDAVGCRGVFASGFCAENAVVRCDSQDLKRPLSRQDCASIGKVCKTTEAGAACVPPTS